MKWLEKPWVPAAVVTALVLMWMTLHVAAFFGGNWTALFLHGDKFGVPAELKEGSYVFAQASGYDGQFYRLLAHDPFLVKGYAAYMDAPVMRARRILLPGLAWLLGAGQAHRIDAAYIGLNLLALFGGIYFSGRWLMGAGRRPWWGVGFAVMPATLAGIERMVTDLMFTAIFAAYLYCAQSGRWRGLWICAMALCLSREPGFLCVAGVVIWLAWRRDWGRAAGFATAGIPGACWYAYVYWRLGSKGAGGAQFASPVVAVVGRAVTKWGAWQGFQTGPVLDWVSIVCYILALGMAVWWLAQQRGTWTVEMPALAMMTALFWMTGEAEFMLEPMGYGRAASPLLLALFLNGVAERRWLMAGAAIGVTSGMAPYLKVSLQRIADRALGG